MRIAVYTIAKNEEQFVQRWAESTADADHRLILDTGSTDNTLHLADNHAINPVLLFQYVHRFENFMYGVLPGVAVAGVYFVPSVHQPF